MREITNLPIFKIPITKAFMRLNIVDTVKSFTKNLTSESLSIHYIAGMCH